MKTNDNFFLSNSRWTSQENMNEFSICKFIPHTFVNPRRSTNTHLSLADDPSGPCSSCFVECSDCVELKSIHEKKTAQLILFWKSNAAKQMATGCTADRLYRRPAVQPTGCTADRLYSRPVGQPTGCTAERLRNVAIWFISRHRDPLVPWGVPLYSLCYNYKLGLLNWSIK
jgi:hypothetical protein